MILLGDHGPHLVQLTIRKVFVATCKNCPELGIHSGESTGFRWQGASTKDGFEIDPLPLDIVHLMQVHVQITQSKLFFILISLLGNLVSQTDVLSEKRV